MSPETLTPAVTCPLWDVAELAWRVREPADEPRTLEPWNPKPKTLARAAEGYRDLSRIKRHGAPLTCRLRPERAFGLLPALGPVAWACLPISDAPLFPVGVRRLLALIPAVAMRASGPEVLA